VLAAEHAFIEHARELGVFGDAVIEAQLVEADHHRGVCLVALPALQQIGNPVLDGFTRGHDKGSDPHFRIQELGVRAVFVPAASGKLPAVFAEAQHACLDRSLVVGERLEEERALGKDHASRSPVSISVPSGTTTKRAVPRPLDQSGQAGS